MDGSVRAATATPGRRLALLSLGVSLLFATSAAATPVTLEECARRALERSPAVRAADLQRQSAAAQARAARAGYWPRLEAHSEYGRSEGFDETVTNGGSTAALLRLEATLLDGGRRRAEIDGAEARMRSAAAVEAQQRADLLFEVRSAYFQTVAADREAQIHVEATTALDGILRLLGAEAAAGGMPENDLLRARLALTAERTAERAARTQSHEARAALSSLAGLDLSTATLSEPSNLPSHPAANTAYDSSPLLTEARAALAAAERDADAVRSEGAGRITLAAEAGALGVRPAQTFEHDGGGQFLLGFTVPIFDGGVRAAHLASAIADAEKARASLDEVTRTLRLSWVRASAEERRATQDHTAARQRSAIARRNFELMRARQAGGGDVRLLEVLDALTQWVDARLDESRARLAGRTARAAEAQLIGEASP